MQGGRKNATQNKNRRREITERLNVYGGSPKGI